MGEALLRRGRERPSDVLDLALDAAGTACSPYEVLARKWPERFEGIVRDARAVLVEVLEQLGERRTKKERTEFTGGILSLGWRAV